MTFDPPDTPDTPSDQEPRSPRERRAWAQTLKDFVEYSLIWYSEQFAIPFWVVGQVHLHTTDYHADVKTFASMGLHMAVALGFWLGFKRSQREG